MNSNFNTNQPEFYWGIGTDEVAEGIFERFPKLIPAVGDNYWRPDGKHRKMLLVGESNYFKDYPESVSVFKNAERWYKEDTNKLIPEEMKDKVRNWKGDCKPVNAVYKVMDEVLIAKGIEHEYGLPEAAFYNYFLRPALNDGKNRGFKPEKIDEDVAGVALVEIIKRLECNLVIFLSKLAFDKFDSYYKNLKPEERFKMGEVNIQHVAHPSSIWWNRNGGEYGKVKFRRLLEQYWLL